MSSIFGILTTLSFIVFIVGMVKPKLVMQWAPETKQNRKWAAIISIAGFFIFAGLAGATMTPEEKAEQVEMHDKYAASKVDKLFDKLDKITPESEGVKGDDKKGGALMIKGYVCTACGEESVSYLIFPGEKEKVIEGKGMKEFLNGKKCNKSNDGIHHSELFYSKKYVYRPSQKKWTLSDSEQVVANKEVYKQYHK